MPNDSFATNKDMSSAPTEQDTPIQEVKFSQEFFDFLKGWIAYLRLQDTEPKDIAAAMIPHFQAYGLQQPGLNMDDDAAVAELLNTNASAREQVFMAWLCSTVGTLSQESQQIFAEWYAQVFSLQPAVEDLEFSEEDLANMEEILDFQTTEVANAIEELEKEETNAVAAEDPESEDPESADEDPESADEDPESAAEDPESAAEDPESAAEDLTLTWGTSGAAWYEVPCVPRPQSPPLSDMVSVDLPSQSKPTHAKNTEAGQRHGASGRGRKPRHSARRERKPDNRQNSSLREFLENELVKAAVAGDMKKVKIFTNALNVLSKGE